ncbi:hypothetical protein SNOG_15541 [Parastagonospora nodorum SN15]|uniref:Uncharacterized protein n=2 Tax=Phaeosphaeria nodorum (strain SN15 / ATCC MYA-4574 / FGSC 10173) TaxID=321614 RepID=Q0TYK2_PHANO|nr:hypothetical protein SNOG_15541 [Parastagonospora nodorum SN15]EAT77206.1 hypothetical protein SNOG_15541 [Parastagonospora nodorum SN15]QRD05381.1 hypothetical protein JI435_155410 [Parastagonospora nodorum SN15]
MAQSMIITSEPENVKSVLAPGLVPWDGSLAMVSSQRMARVGSIQGQVFGSLEQLHLSDPASPGAQVSDFEGVETHFYNLVDKLPKDGETKELQRLFFNFTIDNSTEFLLGQQSALIDAGYVVIRLVQHVARIEARGSVFRQSVALTLSHADGGRCGRGYR